MNKATEFEMPRANRHYLCNHIQQMALLGMRSIKDLQVARTRWVEDYAAQCVRRDSCWTDSVAVGTERFVTRVQEELEDRANKRSVLESTNGAYQLRDAAGCYAVNSLLEMVA